MAFPSFVKGDNNWERFLLSSVSMSFTCHGSWNKLFYLWNFLANCRVKSHFLVLSSQIVATGEPPTSEFWPKVVFFSSESNVHSIRCYTLLHETLHVLVLVSSHALCIISFCQAFYLNSGNRFTVLFYTHSSTWFMKPQLTSAWQGLHFSCWRLILSRLNLHLTYPLCVQVTLKVKNVWPKVQNTFSRYYQLNILL